MIFNWERQVEGQGDGVARGDDGVAGGGDVHEPEPASRVRRAIKEFRNLQNGLEKREEGMYQAVKQCESVTSPATVHCPAPDSLPTGQATGQGAG